MTTERQLYRYKYPGDPQCWIETTFTENNVEYHLLNSSYGIPVTIPKEEFKRDYEPVTIDGWRDISEAPTSGLKIEAWHRGWNCTISVFWRLEEGFMHELPWSEIATGNMWPTSAFSHYRLPLPPAPKATSGENI